jgi:hypothetical protein
MGALVITSVHEGLSCVLQLVNNKPCLGAVSSESQVGTICMPCQQLCSASQLSCSSSAARAAVSTAASMPHSTKWSSTAHGTVVLQEPPSLWRRLTVQRPITRCAPHSCSCRTHALAAAAVLGAAAARPTYTNNTHWQARRCLPAMLHSGVSYCMPRSCSCRHLCKAAWTQPRCAAHVHP